MNTPRTVVWDELLADREGPCVSIYLPTARIGDPKGDSLRLRDLVDLAEDRVTARGVRPVEARRLLEPARKLVTDPDVGRWRSDALAVFAAGGLFRYYQLPITVAEAVQVDRRFHVTPLVGLWSGDGEFYVLTLSQNHVRLWRGSRYDFVEDDAAKLPPNLTEALQLEPLETGRQSHGNVKPGKGRQETVFHGQGSLSDRAKGDLGEFFNQVSAAVTHRLHGKSAPLLLATVDYLVPLYREVNSYPHLSARHVSGNFDRAGADELHALAWPIVAEEFDLPRRAAIARCSEEREGVQVSHELIRVVTAACDGRVDTLMVDPNWRQWGAFDAQTREVRVLKSEDPATEDLVNLAVVATKRNGGKVYAVDRSDLPGASSLAAIFRRVPEPAYG